MADDLTDPDGPTTIRSTTRVAGRRGRARHRGNGGVAARRAVIRWAWRLFRREWRQQVLVLVLLVVAVAAATGTATAAYNTVAAPDDAAFGTANHLFRFNVAGGTEANAPSDTGESGSPDDTGAGEAGSAGASASGETDEGSPAETSPSSGADGETDGWRRGVAAAEEWFGDVEVITHRYERVPGSTETVELRAQDPRGVYGAPMLDLRDGRYPRRAGEVAVTDWVATTFEVGVGGVLDVGGAERRVVGMVENPNDLHAEFALVPPAEGMAPEAVTLLVRDSAARVDAFPASQHLQSDDGELTVGSRRGNEDVAAAIGVLGMSVVALVLVALVAAASFVVVAQRRLRQLGMLGAIGATERHVRLVVVANGVVVGLVAGLLGAALGIGGWLAVEPRLESAAGHRIDPLHVPWWLVGAASLLAVLAATGAAWWPARAVARVPVTAALSGRPPAPRSLHASAVLAGGLLLAGIACLVWGDRRSPLLVSVGTVATVAGVLLASPLAIRALVIPARWFPVAVRLALRDLARYQARSGMALAAISLALGIPVAVVVTAAAAQPPAGEGNLADDQLLIRVGDPDDPTAPCPGPVQVGEQGVFGGSSGPCPFLPHRTPSQVAELEDQVDQIVARLDEPAVTTLDVAYDPELDPGPDGRSLITLAQDFGEVGSGGLVDISLLYVATPDTLAPYGLRAEDLDPDVEVLTVETGEVWFAGLIGPDSGPHGPEPIRNLHRLSRNYSSLPGTLITPEALRRRGWESARAGWLVDTASPLTDAQFDAARDQAAGAGLIVEARDEHEDLATLQARATAVGMLLALAVLAMTVGLIRTEAAGDLRTLTATGATSTTRRTLTASTAGGLGLLGVALGTVGAYVALAAGYLGEVGTLRAVPVVHLLVMAAGVPLVAAAAGWLLAGREPAALARQAIE